MCIYENWNAMFSCALMEMAYQNIVTYTITVSSNTRVIDTSQCYLHAAIKILAIGLMYLPYLSKLVSVFVFLDLVYLFLSAAGDIREVFYKM